jgi:hypothetical protein
MGKVGSTAVAEALRKYGFWVLHIHSLNAPVAREYLKTAIAANQSPPPATIDTFAYSLTSPLISAGTRVITLVRDPIARDLSDFFQVLSPATLEHEDHAGLLAQYLSANTLDHTLGWLDHEIKRFLGIDVYASDFDPNRGARTYRENDVHLLLLKAELGQAHMSKEIEDWLGIESLPIEIANDSRAKDYGNAYGDFLTTVRLPESLVARVFDSKYARHFYSAEQRGELVDRWTKGAGGFGGG